MASCNICGKKQATVISNIEGVNLNVCKDCAKLGKLVYAPKPKSKPKIESKPQIEKTVVMDYSKKIKQTREKNKLTQEEFADMLNEKLSVIRNIEHGKFVPSLKLAEKIQDKFNIVLIEEQGEVRGASLSEKTETATLGDMITIKKRKK